MQHSVRIDYTAGCAFLSEKELRLTPIEYKLLCVLARNCGKVLTHKFITQQVWGTACGCVQTVEAFDFKGTGGFSVSRAGVQPGGVQEVFTVFSRL